MPANNYLLIYCLRTACLTSGSDYNEFQSIADRDGTIVSLKSLKKKLPCLTMVTVDTCIPCGLSHSSAWRLLKL